MAGDKAVAQTPMLQEIDRVIRNGIGMAASLDLSEREREILECLTKGDSNKVIARKFGITDNTVKYHLKKVFIKLDFSTRCEAAAKNIKRATS